MMATSVPWKPSTPAVLFTDDQRVIIDSVIVVVSSLSLLGSLFVIASYLTFARFHTFRVQLLTFISVADCVAAVAWLLHPLQISDTVAGGSGWYVI